MMNSLLVRCQPQSVETAFGQPIHGRSIFRHSANKTMKSSASNDARMRNATINRRCGRPLRFWVLGEVPTLRSIRTVVCPFMLGQGGVVQQWTRSRPPAQCARA